MGPVWQETLKEAKLSLVGISSRRARGRKSSFLLLHGERPPLTLSPAWMDGWSAFFPFFFFFRLSPFPVQWVKREKTGNQSEERVWEKERERIDEWEKVERESRFPFFSLTLSCIAKPERERVYFCLFSLSSAGRKSWRHQIYAKVIQLRLPIGLLGTVNHAPPEDWEPQQHCFRSGIKKM